jgi:hypothetical protein
MHDEKVFGHYTIVGGKDGFGISCINWPNRLKDGVYSREMPI